MQPGPGGAQCALHVGVSANFVCARCGNFMCAGCAVGGGETQCPRCRELSPIGFPYDSTADFGTLWAHTTSSFQRELSMCIIAGLIFLAFAFAGGIVSNIVSKIIGAILGIETDSSNPFGNLAALGAGFVVGQVVGTVVNMAVQGIALVGLYRLLMDVLVGKKAELGRMFSQLHLLPQYVVMHVVMFVTITVPSFVYFGGVALVGAGIVGLKWSRMSDFRPELLLNPALVALFVGSIVLFVVVTLLVLPVTLFSTPELIVGQCGPLEALKRSWALGEGQRLRAFGYSLVSGLVVMAGAVACLVGLIVALPLAYMLLLALFLAVRRSASLPAAIHT